MYRRFESSRLRQPLIRSIQPRIAPPQTEVATLETSVRQLQPADRAQWEPLWVAYQAFYGVNLGGAPTEATWQRVLDPAEPVHGLGVFDEDQKLLGMVHFLFHRTTWSAADTCYLQDLYVIPEMRGQGLARKLIEAVYAAARRQGAAHVYWLTHESNATARRLYDRLATNSGFIVYEHPLASA